MREATPEMRYHREREPEPLDEASHDACLTLGPPVTRVNAFCHWLEHSESGFLLLVIQSILITLFSVISMAFFPNFCNWEIPGLFF